MSQNRLPGIANPSKRLTGKSPHIYCLNGTITKVQFNL